MGNESGVMWLISAGYVWISSFIPGRGSGPPRYEARKLFFQEPSDFYLFAWGIV